MHSRTVAEVLFGKQTLRLDFPTSIQPVIIRKPAMPVVDDPAAAIQRAFDHPVPCPADRVPQIRSVLDSSGANPSGNETRKTIPTSNHLSLETIASPARSACIVICDITRPVPNHLFLRPLIERLLANGIEQRNISILVATGLHRPNLGSELEELIGDPWVMDNISITNHDARCDEDHVDLGTTSRRNTPILINRLFAQADLRIVTGLVEPHFMAGFSGGRKVIAPGIAHARTITTFHNYRFMADPACLNCNLDGNPLHEEQLEIVKRIGGCYAINTVIDEQRNLSFVNFGEVTSSHLQAVEYIREFCQVPVQEPFDIVITSGAGYPLDKTYYQTVKGIVGAVEIVRPGGELVIASQCSEGLGSAEYVVAQQKLIQQGVDGFLDSIRDRSQAEIDHWQTQMQTRAMTTARIRLFSDLGPEERKLTGTDHLDDLQGYVDRIPPGTRVAVIPEGPYVIPRLHPTPV